MGGRGRSRSAAAVNLLPSRRYRAKETGCADDSLPAASDDLTNIRELLPQFARHPRILFLSRVPGFVCVEVVGGTTTNSATDLMACRFCEDCGGGSGGDGPRPSPLRPSPPLSPFGIAGLDSERACGLESIKSEVGSCGSRLWGDPAIS